MMNHKDMMEMYDLKQVVRDAETALEALEALEIQVHVVFVAKGFTAEGVLPAVCEVFLDENEAMRFFDDSMEHERLNGKRAVHIHGRVRVK